MGVDYYQCQSCDRGYRDDSDYATYCDCGANFCNKKCGKVTNLKEQDDYTEADHESGDYRIDKTLSTTCVLCRKEQVTDYILLNALLKHYTLTREQVIDIYMNQVDE